MSDYARLADIAKLKEIVDQSTFGSQRKAAEEPCTLVKSVRKYLTQEMNKANVELLKKRAPTFDQIQVPSFGEEILLTYGTNELCRVSLGITGRGCRITAVISGPPNGYEISRREYLCKHELACSEVLATDETRLKTFAFGPEEVASDIIGSVIVGRFS